MHEEYMKIAFELALKGRGNVEPNPMVGAVIVKNGKILGAGYHKKFGAPHAEIEAINNCPDYNDIKGSTLYVTLEPCCHYGKTPPCVQAISKAGIKCVVIAKLDPNPLVNGRGVKYLRDHGIKVIKQLTKYEIRNTQNN